MDMNRDQQESRNGNSSEIQIPFLANISSSSPSKATKTPAQVVARKTLKSTTHLSNLLPTGSVLVFSILSRILTHDGKCRTPVNWSLMLGLIASCVASCFALSFTDSFRDEQGKVRYGLATFQGLMIIDGSNSSPLPEEAMKFRIRMSDFVHAIMSMLMFAAVVVSDENVVPCFFPKPSEEVVELVTSLPALVGVICSVLFVAFPSRRHGIGFPVSRR